MQFNTWLELFDFIASKISVGKWTLYLEEVQWLAEYKNELISDLKYVWDNTLRHNPNLLLDFMWIIPFVYAKSSHPFKSPL